MSAQSQSAGVGVGDGAAATAVVLPTGPPLAAHLAAIDNPTLDDHDLIETIADWERLAAWVAAGQLAAAADFARRPQRMQHPDDDRTAVSAQWARPGRWVREYADDELAARLRISRHDASARIGLGCALVALPATHASLGAGRIDLRRAKVMAEETRTLDATTAREVEAALIATAEALPAARLKPKVRAAAIDADPVAAERRVKVAQGERKVVVFPAEDGMADLWAHLPAVQAVAIQSAIATMARSSATNRAPGDDRTMDQRKADALAAPFLDALTTGELCGTRLAQRRGQAVELQVTVAASTLMGLDEAPAMLKGYGAITADTTRGLVPDARLRRIVTDPVSGTVLDVGSTVYKPPTALLRHVQVRDQRCTFPGCGAPAESSEFDHTVPFPKGPTSAANAGMRCKRHHLLKHSGSVGVEQLEDGTSRWTMPTGHVYDVELPCVDPALDARRTGTSQPADTRPPDTRPPDTRPPDADAETDADTGIDGRPEPPERPPF